MKHKIKNEIINKKSRQKGNNSIILIALAVIIIIGGAYTLFSGGSQKTDLKKSMTLKEVRALIDTEYGKKAPGTNTPPVKDNYVPILSPKKAGKLPDYAVTNAMTLSAYKYATEHPEVLEQIPCYCGCGEHGSKTSGGKPHKSVRDCFINDEGVYDDHASFCDVCVGIATKAMSYFPSGIPVAEAQTEQIAPAQSINMSALSLSENFKSIADGLKLTPSGVSRAYFINTKMLAGTEMESKFLQDNVRPDSFYGKKIIGMYSADFSTDSWIEFHDLGYDNKNDAAIKEKKETGMKNIVTSRPMVFGHSENVDNVLKIMNNPASMTTAYPTYKPLLDSVDYQNAAYVLLLEQKNKFSDMNYESMQQSGDRIKLVKAYRITDSKSIPSAFSTYESQTTNNILKMTVTGDLQTITKAKDNIDAAARS